jgi:hypothetical protein
MQVDVLRFLKRSTARDFKIDVQLILSKRDAANDALAKKGRKGGKKRGKEEGGGKKRLRQDEGAVEAEKDPSSEEMEF